MALFLYLFVELLAHGPGVPKGHANNRAQCVQP